MKKFILALVALFWMTVTTTSAMSYEQARQQALFLTDKMAYELNLTDDQYEAAYEINLDYLMGVNSVDDLYGTYWRQRNLDLSYILLDWQYRSFVSASYFYRPLYWDGGFWHFGIYARYPRRDYFYFGRPQFINVYCGGHSWRMNGGRSWYHGREWGGPRPGGQPRIGMRDGFNRGDYGRGDFNRGRNFGNRQSSTRSTVTRDRQWDNNPSINNRRDNMSTDRRNTPNMNNKRNDRPSYENSRQPNNSNRSFGNATRQNRSNVFGGNRSFGNGNNTPSNSTRSFTPRSTTTPTPNFGGGSRNGGSNGGHFGGNNGGGHFGNRR